MLKVYTVREVRDALIKNGFHLLRERWIVTDTNGRVTGGCILGQAAVNLGVSPNGDYLAYDEEGIYSEREKHTLHKQLNRFKVGGDLTFHHMERGAGSAIIDWNDASIKNEYLLSDQEVKDKASEILEPFLDEKVTLEVFEWKIGAGNAATV